MSSTKTTSGFLNDLIAQLWPNINIAGCAMVKDMVEPMFKTMLPGPLAGLKFTKMDLGPVPIKVSQVDVIKTDSGGISLDMDVTWHSKSDFELDASMMPEIGIEHIHLSGRLSILLAPLTNIIPCVRTPNLILNPSTSH
jgi:Ca2+-dependent lipid-binding protein